MDVEKIGKFIKELRKEKGYSQNSLSEEIHITRQAISNWENGKAIPDSDILKKLSSLFEVSIDEILAGERGNTNIEEIALSLIDENNKGIMKRKRIIRISISTVILLLLLFLGYYFFINYNSIKVYTISGKSNNYTIREGLIISTQNKNYLRIGEIESKNNNEKDIETITLLYMDKNNKEHKLYETSNKEYITYEFSFKNAYDTKQLLYNMYMLIKNDNEVELLNIILNVDFKNDFNNNINKKDNLKVVLKKEVEEKESLSDEPNNNQIQEEKIEANLDEKVFKEEVDQKQNNNDETIEPPIEENNTQDIETIDYYEIKRIIEEKGTDQFGKYTVELMIDNQYICISTFMDNIYVETLKDNIIESWQFDIKNQNGTYQMLENFMEVSHSTYSCENNIELYEKMNLYLKELKNQ